MESAALDNISIAFLALPQLVNDKIFDYLDLTSLTRLRLISKQWKNLVEQTRYLGRIQLHIHSNTQTKLLNSGRRHTWSNVGIEMPHIPQLAKDPNGTPPEMILGMSYVKLFSDCIPTLENIYIEVQLVHGESLVPTLDFLRLNIIPVLTGNLRTFVLMVKFSKRIGPPPISSKSRPRPRPAYNLMRALMPRFGSQSSRCSKVGPKPPNLRCKHPVWYNAECEAEDSVGLGRNWLAKNLQQLCPLLDTSFWIKCPDCRGFARVDQNGVEL